MPTSGGHSLTLQLRHIAHEKMRGCFEGLQLQLGPDYWFECTKRDVFKGLECIVFIDSRGGK